ncbi:Ig-like domain repeat protein [uncultured Methanobrevibacter sp.]|uniref:Ig-like domain repeat protein n=1 Tax=uncultured Methanobrevibacter sp. TaxID=253161 RepID=UPI00260CE799|nr:Ig-like domain repeat protein [uncultured Methanobrevibacter sp.]
MTNSISSSDLDSANILNEDVLKVDDCPEEISLEDKSDSVIVSDNCTFYKNGNYTYDVSLKDDLGNPIANAPLIFEINNNTYNHTTNSNGSASFLNIPNLDVGEYIIKTKFLGNELYNPANTTNHIIIKSTIISDDFTKVYTSDSSFKAYFLDYDGTLLNNTRVGFQIKNTTYNRTTNNYGLAKQAIGLTPGNYTVTIINYYTNERITNKIEVIPQIVENSDLTKYFRSDKDFIVRIIDNAGYPVGAGKTVSFTVNGATYNRTTDSSGYAKMQINLYPGQYTITTHYNATTVTNNLIVLSTILTSNLDMKAKDGSQFEALILDGNGRPYPNQHVTFTINNVVYNRTTNQYGIAALTINLNSGSYLIKTTYNTYYRNNYIHTTLTTSKTKKNTVITILNLQREVNQTGTIQVKLTDNNANILTKKSILFTINGVKYNRLTGTQGEAKLNYRLAEGRHNFTVSFSGDQDYKTKSTTDYVNVAKLNTTLHLSGSWTLSEKELIEFHLKDSKGNIITNEEVTFTINNTNYTNTTDNNGYAKLIIDLNPGNYTASINYNGSPYYHPSSNTTTFTVSENTIFSYSLIIPNYINMTNDWTIYPREFNLNYISQTGVNGKVKMPIAREIMIITPTDNYTYFVGAVPYGEEYLISYNESRHVNSTDFNIHIKSDANYTNITYYGYFKKGVNNFNIVYQQPFFGIGRGYEEVLIMDNGKVSGIAFSEPIFHDETGIRCAFIENESLIYHTDLLDCRYDTYSNYNTLRFSQTNETVIYSEDLLSIENNPSYEKIATNFRYNDISIDKNEFVSFGNLLNTFAGIEVVQSYTLSDVIVTDSILDYYLNPNGIYYFDPSINSLYSNFLIGLSTIWKYDEFTLGLTDLLNLTANRENTALCMAGVEFGGKSYVHAPDPLMGINITGENNTNIKLCKAFTSLLLSEIESQVLYLTGIESISSMDYLFTEIINGQNYTVNITNNTLTIKLANDNTTLWLLDMENGTVYSLFINNNFTYKGATSQNSEYCCPNDFLTSITNALSGTLYKNNSDTTNPKSYANNGLSDTDKKILLQIGASAAATLSAAFIMISLPYIGIIPFFPVLGIFIGAGCLLFGVSLLLNYYENGENGGKALVSTSFDFFMTCVS